MDIRNHLFFVILLGFLSMQFQCERRLGCAENIYSFHLPVAAYPEKDTVAQGDTLWLRIEESTKFVDERSGSFINYSNAANLGTSIAFQVYDSTKKNWVKAVDSFSFYLLEGYKISEDPLFMSYLFLEKQGTYRFKLGIVPKAVGLYRVILSNSNNTFRTNDRCTKASFSIIFRNTNQNRHLTGYSGAEIVGGDYYFFVK